jgi:hypothetical protein
MPGGVAGRGTVHLILNPFEDVLAEALPLATGRNRFAIEVTKELGQRC